MDYQRLVSPKSTPGSIASWANYSMMPVEAVLEDAQALLYQTMRVREMRSEFTALPVELNSPKVAIPDDFLDPIVLTNQLRQKIQLTDITTVLQKQKFQADGTTLIVSSPGYYAITGSSFNFNCALNNNYTYWLSYFQLPEPLSESNQTNFLTRRYPNILRTACLAIAADFRKDDGDYNRCMQRLTQLIMSANANDDLVNRGMEMPGDYRGS